MNIKMKFLGIGIIASIFFAILKILKLIDVSWFMVAIPALIDFVLIILMVILFVVWIKGADNEAYL